MKHAERKEAYSQLLSEAEFTCEFLKPFRKQPSSAIPRQPTSEDIKPGQDTNDFHPEWVFTLVGLC